MVNFRRLLDRLVVRLVLVVIAAGVAAAILVAVLVGNLARSTIRSEIATGNLTRAQDLAVRFDTRVDTVTTNLLIAAGHPAIQDLERSAETTLRALLARSETFDELVLFDADGAPVAAAASRFLATPEDYPDRPDLAALSEPSARTLEVFPPMLEVTTPVEFPPGNVLGTLLGRVPLELVGSHIQQQSLTNGTDQFLLDGSQRVLVTAARDLMAQETVYPLPAFYTGSAVHGVTEIDNDRWLVAVAPTESFEGAVVVTQQEAAALAPVASQLRQLSLIVVALIGATVVGVSLMGRFLLRPLQSLTRAVEKFGQGHYDARAEEASGEIGAVAREFNHMADRLSRRRSEVSEMHALSLLVTSREDRQAVADDIVSGIRRLLGAEAAAFTAVDDQGALDPVSTSGPISEWPSAEEVSRRTLGSGEVVVAAEQDGVVISLPISEIDGELSGVLVVVRREGQPDIEEIRLAETFASFAGVAVENVRRLELQQLLVHELQQALDRRRELLGNITHDLRSPVVCISNFSARLNDEWRDMEPAAAELLNEIMAQAEILDSLIGSLLEFNAAERGPHRLTSAPVPVHRPLNAAIDTLGSLLDGRPIRVDVADIEVMADFILLTRVLMHLLSNAARFSPPSTPIAVRADVNGGIVTIEVEDEGVGLTEEEAAIAFEPFWKRVESTDQPQPGLGLGLSLTRDYIKAMGGELGVRSRPGRGSVFYFTLTSPASVGGEIGLHSGDLQYPGDSGLSSDQSEAPAEA